MVQHSNQISCALGTEHSNADENTVKKILSINSCRRKKQVPIKQNVAVITKTVKEITPHMWEGGQSLLNAFGKKKKTGTLWACGESKNSSGPRSSVSQLKCTVVRMNWRG